MKLLSYDKTAMLGCMLLVRLFIIKYHYCRYRACSGQYKMFTVDVLVSLGQPIIVAQHLLYP